MKPVAWMSPDGKLSTTEGKLFHIPLYTSPRELSDDEISLQSWMLGYQEGKASVAMDKAILKKASDK
jgi:hypothetical protein